MHLRKLLNAEGAAFLKVKCPMVTKALVFSKKERKERKKEGKKEKININSSRSL